MSISARLTDAPLSVLLDLRHPLATLALGPTRAFLERRGITANWLPLTVPPLNPPSDPAPGDDRGVRHRRSRARAIAREIDVYSAAQGLVLRELYRTPDPGAANMAWLWMREQHPAQLPAFLDALFREYWSCALDLSDAQDLAHLVEAQGADSRAFLEWADAHGAAALEAVAAELRDFGLFQVPAFVVEDEVFYGRQHLPMIEWILDGREGTVPI